MRTLSIKNRGLGLVIIQFRNTERDREMKCLVFRAGDNTIQEYREIER